MALRWSDWGSDWSWAVDLAFALVSLLDKLTTNVCMNKQCNNTVALSPYIE